MLPTKFWFIWPSSYRGEDLFRNRPIRSNNFMWRPCLLTDREEMKNLYRGPYIDASYQVLVHLTMQFQRIIFRNRREGWEPLRSMMLRFNYMMLTVMTALSVLFLSSLTISSCDMCKTVLGGLGLWVIYNSFEFVADAVYMSDLI